MPKWARVLTAFAAAILLLFIYALFFGYQTFAIIETRRLAAKYSVMNKTPVALSDLSVSQTGGPKLSYFGYDFVVPWTDIDDTKTKLGKNRVVITFRSGSSMMLTSVPARDFINGIQSTFQLTREKLQGAFGDAAVQSDYSFKTLILNTTPRQVTLTTPWRKCNSILMLLTFKTAMLASPDADLFAIQTKEFKGFQVGDPAQHLPKMAVELYSENGELEFYFYQKANGLSLSLSQADLNHFIESVDRTANPGALASEVASRTGIR